MGALGTAIRVVLATAIILVALPVFARIWVSSVAHGRVYSDIHKVPKCRVAVVLGSRVYPSGALCTILARRVDKAIELYKAGKVEKLLMSGDNSVTHYNEPKRMLDYAVRHGVPREDIGMDFAGRSTYASVYRAKHIFGLNKFIVVSQAYHLDRTIFLCSSLGVDAYGAAAEMPHYPKGPLREFPACVQAIADAYVRHPVPIMGEREKI
jgi:SanA protein